MKKKEVKKNEEREEEFLISGTGRKSGKTIYRRLENRFC
jgi:hypothetical protein